MSRTTSGSIKVLSSSPRRFLQHTPSLPVECLSHLAGSGTGTISTSSGGEVRAQSGAMGGFSALGALERRGRGTKGAAVGFRVVVEEVWFVSLMPKALQRTSAADRDFSFGKNVTRQSPSHSTPSDAVSVPTPSRQDRSLARWRKCNITFERVQVQGEQQMNSI